MNNDLSVVKMKEHVHVLYQKRFRHI